MKKWTVYSVTNLVNGRRYIGVHKTADPEDDYLGSGKLIRYAVEKYGRENFRKEVLLVTEDKAEAFALEASLVTKDTLESGELYNLKEGGEGGWDFCNSDRNIIYRRTRKWFTVSIASFKHASKDPKMRSKASERMTALNKSPNRPRGFRSETASPETRMKWAESKKITSAGERNSQFGTVWITDGTQSRKIKKDESVPSGWTRGRVTRR